jgi:hypothetical protein
VAPTVLAAAAVPIADVSTLSVFRLSKLASTSSCVSGEPLPARVTIVAMCRLLY